MKNLWRHGLLALWLFVSTADAQQFENAYRQPRSERGLDVAEMSDGSIITVGTASGYGKGGDDLMVMKTNASGSVLWTRYYGSSGDDAGNAVVISPQREIYVAGTTTTASGKLGYIVKLNAAGGLIWARTYGSGTYSELKDIGFKSSRIYAVGVTNGAGAGGNDIWLLKTDTGGVVIQNKTLGTATADQATAMCFTSDGNIALCGQSLGYAPNLVILAKVNLSCDTLWTRKFNLNLTTTSTTYIARGIAELSTQELVLTGRGFDVGINPSTFHLKTDQSGNTVFTRWTSLLSDDGMDVLAGTNGSYYLLINSCNFGCRTLIAKYDNAGNQLLSSEYGYPGGSSYGSFTSGIRFFRNASSKLLLAGSSFLNAYNEDILLSRLDSNGAATTTFAPQITASGPTTFCTGTGTGTCLIAPAGYDYYCWGRMQGGSLSFLQVNNDTVFPTASGIYYCVCWSANTYRVSNLINITVNTLPAPGVSASGSLSFCAASGDSVVFTATAGFTYQWQQNGVNIPGATASKYTAKSSGGYHVQVSSVCGSVTSQLFQVNANSIQAPVLNCNGDCFAGQGLCYPPGTLSAATTGTITNYQWFLDGVPYGPGGAGATQVVPPYPGGNYTCTASNGCGAATSAAYLVQSGPPFGASGTEIQLFASAGCGLGSNISLQAPIGSSAPWQWLLNGSPISGATNYWYSATQSGWYSLQYYDPYCFTTNTTPSLQINLNTPNPVLTAPNGASNCTGPVLLSVTTPGTQFQWFRNEVNLGLSAAGSTYTATQSGVYKCNVYNPACGWDITNAVTVAAGGGGTPVLSATATEICSGTSTTLMCSPSSGSGTYQWYSNGSIIPGAAAATYTTAAAGSYVCNLTNACGTTPSNTLTITVTPTPVATIVPPASTLICSGQLKTLSVVPVAGCSYQWRNGTLPVAGATDTVYLAGSAGTYSVQVRQGTCSATSAQVTLTTSSVTTPYLTMTGYPQICSGESFTMTAVPTNAAYTYQWKRNGSNIAGATAGLYTTGTAGTYQVEISSGCGVISLPEVVLTVRSKPSAAVTALGPLSFCSGDSVQLQTNTAGGLTYYWKRNSQVIPGATTAVYTAKTAGSYRAGVYSLYGCLKESAILNVSVPCREANEVEPFSFTLFPNPASGPATLSFTGLTGDDTLEIIVTDLTGRRVAVYPESVSDGLLITVPESGVYLITVSHGEQHMTKRLVRIN